MVASEAEYVWEGDRYLVSVYKDDCIEIIRNEQGKRTPSWVDFGNNQTLIGEAAKDQAHLTTSGLSSPCLTKLLT